MLAVPATMRLGVVDLVVLVISGGYGGDACLWS